MTKTSVQNILVICKTHQLPVPALNQTAPDWYSLHWPNYATWDEDEAREHLRALYVAGERATYADPKWPRHPLCRLGYH